MKALIEHKKMSAPRSHDLMILVNLAQPELARLLLLKQELERLSSYAVAARYPGENATKTQAKRALKIAGLVRETILTRLAQKRGQ